MADSHPVTLAVRALRAANVAFTPTVFPYVEKGGTRHSSEILGVDEHLVIKTLIFEDETKAPVCVLMHGDREVSTKALARALGKKAFSPCAPAVAQKHSGYLVGGTSPFGLKRQMPVLLERSIASLDRLFINGGARGFLVELDPKELVRVLGPTLVDVAVPG